ncbi:MAG: hypothetical protein KKG02_07935 [Candidatus Edwardsbacteria bacterium]|nr:hypothetical protein [Candidatus Edwardsbacteria bacterium]
MFVWQVLSLAIFIAGHFFPFYYDISKPDFQVLNILYLLIGLLILYLPFIAAQFLLLLCFKKTTLLKEPEHVAPFIVHSKYLRQKYFLYIMLPIIVTIMAVISQNYIMFFVFFLTLFFGFSDMYYDSVRKIYLTEEDLLFYSANKVIILPFKDINRLSLQKGFINVKKVLGLNGFTDKAHNYFRFTINQQISGYKELIPAIINKCDHLDASFTAKLLKDFQEGNANQK